MCGIAGVIAFSDAGRRHLDKIGAATDCLALRGPDDRGIYIDESVALGHRRLSIIDVSHAAAQPMSDATGRYHIIFNGEFFNFAEHRKDLEAKGVHFVTSSDTEVLLHLYIKEGPGCLEKINGFFALAIYDSQEKTILIARDRMGVKPLLYWMDDDAMFFASEMKALFAFGMPREIDHEAMHLYFQLNYLPPDKSMISKVRKLQPGAYMFFPLNGKPEEKIYYQIPFRELLSPVSYAEAEERIVELLDQSVQRRLVSDVPLGAFLSGGVDSSIIVALASRHVKKLNTYSIGFRDDAHFDETHFADEVAKKFKTNHHVFRLGSDDLLSIIFNVLDYIDEPFADSSALNVYILSRETKKHVTVALSGDGADELFAGYNKHRAEWMLRHRPVMSGVLKGVAPLIKRMEGSRHSKTGNAFRKVKRFSQGAALPPGERYWKWCSIADEKSVSALLKGKTNTADARKHFTDSINNDFNSVLCADMKLVLPGDMLTKVDMMSMANSLEIRNPFIDFEVVDFAFSLPAAYKIDSRQQKKILRNAFRTILPESLFNRRKQGFEVPLLRWLRNDLQSLINELTDHSFVEEQGLFNNDEIDRLKARLFLSTPGDTAARLWALVVFQYWYKKTFKGK